jgi:hypothetical protein
MTSWSGSRLQTYGEMDSMQFLELSLADQFSSDICLTVRREHLEQSKICPNVSTNRLLEGYLL